MYTIERWRFYHCINSVKTNNEEELKRIVKEWDNDTCHVRVSINGKSIRLIDLYQRWGKYDDQRSNKPN